MPPVLYVSEVRVQSKMSRIITIVLCYSSYAVFVNSMTLIDIFTTAVNLCQQRYQKVNLVDCIKERSLIALDNVYRSQNEISVVPDFISLTKYDNVKIEERSAKILPEDLELRSPNDKSSALDNLLVSRLSDFIGSRAINVRIPMSYLDFLSVMPTSNESEKEEGKGRKEMRGLLPMIAMMAGTMFVFKMTAIAVIASKALMASLIAMTLSAIAAFNKKGATHGSTYEVINVPPQGHHSRKLYGDAAAYSNQYHRGEPTSHESLEVDSNT